MPQRPFDIRQYKKSLRLRYKGIRKAMKPEVKAEKDRRILRHIQQMPEYRNCRTLLTYVSVGGEVDTHALIRVALEDGKTVAVPYCLEGTRKMRFYCIRSLEEDLAPRTFGVLEPVPERCRLLQDFTKSLCVLPGLSFDRFGYRLGYGGGYYDRFLSKVYRGGTTAGICYQACTRPHLVHGRFDVPAQWIITEEGRRRAHKQKAQAPLP